MTDKRFEDIVAAALWLKNRSDCSGKIGVTGFCYGGSVSNQLAVRLGADLAAAVPFYGGAPELMASSTTPRPSVTTRQLPLRPGNAWWPGSTPTFAADTTRESTTHGTAVSRTGRQAAQLH